MFSAIPQPKTARRFTRIVDEDASTIRKRGSDFRIEREVQAMTFVREHTNIPVPEILDFQVSKEDSWIRMRRIPGTPLNLAWPEMDADAQTRTANELRSYFTQLRNLTPPEPGWIGSLSKGPAYDH
jgi:aminoglycoside phosphotransferase